MTTISAKFTKKEIDYLESIARKNHLFKGSSKDPSVGKAMKELIKWCQLSEVKIGENKHHSLHELQQMIEQIHATIPHLMYSSRMNLLVNGESLTDEKIAKFRKSSVDYITGTCGEFQTINYKTISPVENENGLGKLPINKNISTWKTGEL